MSRIGVGCGIFGIYAGTVKTRPDGIMQFTGKKTEVTQEVLIAAATWILDNGPKELDYHGKKYLLKFEEVSE